MTTPAEQPETTVKEEEIKEEIAAVEDKAADLQEKRADPSLSDADRAKIEDRLDSLDVRMTALIDKLDKLASSPVAPAPEPKPKQAPAASTTAAKVVDPETAENTSKRRAVVSRRWFGERAYE